jgi:hypothetical protein
MLDETDNSLNVNLITVKDIIKQNAMEASGWLTLFFVSFIIINV